MQELNDRISVMWWAVAAMFVRFCLSKWLDLFKPTGLDWAAFLGLIALVVLCELIRDAVSALIEHQGAMQRTAPGSQPAISVEGLGESQRPELNSGLDSDGT
jgi:hypothetical protein